MAIKYAVVISLVIVFALVAWHTFRHERRFANVPSRGSSLIAFGDSLTAGQGATAGNDYVSDLSRLIGKPVVNAGVNGDTTADALARIERDVLSRDPKVVIILLGGNDVLNGVAVKDTQQNLSEIIDRIEVRGAAVVLVGIRSGLLKDPFGDMFSQLAREKKTAYVPNVLDSIWDRRELMSDSIHPNDRGYAIVAKRIAPKVRQLLR